jgi:hypothetical protein
MPPRWWYLLLLLNCFDWLLLFIIAVGGDKTEGLMPVFFANKETAKYALLAEIPWLALIGLTSQRERLWKNKFTGWLTYFPYLWWSGIVCTLVVSALSILNEAGQFSWPVAYKLGMIMTTSLILLRSRHLRLMLADWRKEH